MIGADRMAAARARAESTLGARATVTRIDPAGTPVFDDTTGQTTYPTVTVWADQPCTIVGTASGTDNVQAGEPVQRSGYELFVAHDAPELGEGDTVTITDPGPNGDPTLTSASFTPVVDRDWRRSTTVLRRIDLAWRTAAART